MRKEKLLKEHLRKYQEHLEYQESLRLDRVHPERILEDIARMFDQEYLEQLRKILLRKDQVHQARVRERFRKGRLRDDKEYYERLLEDIVRSNSEEEKKIITKKVTFVETELQYLIPQLDNYSNLKKKGLRRFSENPDCDVVVVNRNPLQSDIEMW